MTEALFAIENSRGASCGSAGSGDNKHCSHNTRASTITSRCGDHFESNDTNNSISVMMALSVTIIVTLAITHNMINDANNRCRM